VSTYLIVWTCSYAVEALAPTAAIVAVRMSKNYTLAYCCIVAAIIYKLVVIGSLLLGAWKHVGLCYIPYDMKLIIVITNSLEVVCLLVDYVLVYRIKAVNREILIERLMASKTFAEN
jgi:mRNA-degrading endonuclease YafQ of YafQ-DinJ toxin-antitoxin module